LKNYISMIISITVFHVLAKLQIDFVGYVIKNCMKKIKLIVCYKMEKKYAIIVSSWIIVFFVWKRYKEFHLLSKKKERFVWLVTRNIFAVYAKLVLCLFLMKILVNIKKLVIILFSSTMKNKKKPFCIAKHAMWKIFVNFVIKCWW